MADPQKTARLSGRSAPATGGSYEQSAGVIVYRIDRGTRLYLVLNYGKYWDFAKGHHEPGEDDTAAALRELAEETGLQEHDIEVHPDFRREVFYVFRSRDRGVVTKRVCFLLARAHVGRVRISEEHVGFEYLPFEAAVRRVIYPTARELLRRAEAFLTGSSGFTAFKTPENRPE